ncbi:hypothetical protein BDD12DRAFT_873067 [Trichophaea hybrida]|nr:hypothetical protein BDD12DRAFT_873067 [Trichophaea hybrida]
MAPIPKSLSNIYVRFLFLGFAYVASTAPVPVKMPRWLKKIVPKNGTSLRSEIQCYTLPYGAIGMISHVLTYFTIIMLSMGRSPFMPWRILSSPIIDFILATSGLLLGAIIAIFTMFDVGRGGSFC